MTKRLDRGEKLTAEDFRGWVKQLNSLTTVLKRRGDRDSIESLKEQKSRLQEMLLAVGALCAKARQGRTCWAVLFPLGFSDP